MICRYGNPTCAVIKAEGVDYEVDSRTGSFLFETCWPEAQPGMRRAGICSGDTVQVPIRVHSE